ncbi:hypothetical protein T11_14266 [Trichinella zimbabwensis]|uniref:Uncharacterized protein n=1 Tax=Trichinella zimbabwensis TaxID=268475 RepID=A0A0V1HW89_9BILA|nr:hypothetical protein T11_14266 [Trichinella zimbabwensis]
MQNEKNTTKRKNVLLKKNKYKFELKTVKHRQSLIVIDAIESDNELVEEEKIPSNFAYHQLGVSGGAVVDDEHLLTIFEVIFEGDGSADSEAKFAEQRLRTAVGGHRDHVPTLPVHGHGYRPFGQTFGKTKTAASGADAEQHNLQIL